MRRSKKLLKFILLAALILSILCVPAFALDESEVEAAVAASSKEAVTGNVLIWFLCAVAFLKVSQKIDSFMASLGVNVGRTGGSMLADAMVTFRAVTMATGGAGRILGGGRRGAGGSSAGGSSGSGSSSAGPAGFFKGGLIGMAGRHITNSAVKTATTQTSAVHTAQKQGAAAVHTASEKMSASDARTDSTVHSGGVIHTDTISRTDSTAQRDSATQREGIILTGNDTPPAAPIQTGGGSPPAGNPASVGPTPVDSGISSGAAPRENGVILTGADIPPVAHAPADAAAPADNIIVDISDSRIYKNANMAILGTSGAGKTFTMQLMALRMRRKGIQVFIVAPLKGHEFHRACTNIGGEFIQISPASKNCINVTEIRRADKSVDELLDGPGGVDKSLLAVKIQRLHIFFSLLIPDMNHEERQLLDDALIRTYARLGITHENSTLDNPDHPGQYRTMPVLGDLYEVLKESQDTRRLANILNRLVNGSAKTFNQQTNVSLDNKYIVLDISELTGDLLTVGMFVALDFVWDKAKEDRTVEKAIFIDECWQLIGASSNRLAAEFVLEIFKIIRGYGGSAICATQDLNDFFALEDGKYGKGIINNAKTRILLNLEDEEAQRVQSILHLSEAEVMEITHFERGSGLISTNNNNVTVEIKCSQMEKELITTDRRELQELLNRAEGQEAG